MDNIKNSSNANKVSSLPLLWLAVLCIALAVLLALFRGQDANWDLRNYHYYNPYAWVNDRAAIDIAPAQLQSFHSPFADLPYYYLAQAGFSSWISSTLLALPAAVALFFFSLIAKSFLPAEAGRTYLVAVILIAATGAAGGPLVGTTMSEWHLVALFMLAVWLILDPFLVEAKSETVSLSLWRVVGAGFCGGIAVGLKLTAATYAIGLAAMVFTLSASFPVRIQRIIFLGFAGLLGAVISYGPWGYELWGRFGNPFFPYFNDIFQSSWAPLSRFSDDRFAITSLWSYLVMPWLFMKEGLAFVSEVPFRDARLGLGLPALAWLAWREPVMQKRQLWRAIFAMFMATYCVWAVQFSYYRYMSLLELIAALGIVCVAANWSATFSALRGKKFMVMVMVLVVMGSTKWLVWGRIKHGEIAVSAKIPPLDKGTMVIIASCEPLAFVVPSLPSDIPVISLVNNFMNPVSDAHSQLQALAIDRVTHHAGPLLALVSLPHKNEKYYSTTLIADMLSPIGLVVDYQACQSVTTRMSANTIALCNVRRIAPLPLK